MNDEQVNRIWFPKAREWLRDAFDLAPDKKAAKLMALNDPDLER